jgi:predicted nucleic acid-binding protein
MSTIFVPGEVLPETVNMLGKKFSRALAIDTGRLLITSAPFLVTHTDLDTHVSALSLFEQSTGSVSYTDCLVMATANKYVTRHVFGFDDIFQQSGFTVHVARQHAA